MTTDVESNYARTATGILGVPRETILTNELLLKDKLGRPRPRGYVNPFPGEKIIYGMPYPQGMGGVNEALHGWPGSDQRGPGTSDARVDRDFPEMNREAIKAGLVTVPQHNEYRRTHNILRRIEPTSNKNKQSKSIRLPPNYTFGMSTRPPTPIFDLLEHKYQDNWIKQRQALQISKDQLNKKDAVDWNNPIETRTSILRTYKPPVEPEKLWQMKRWNTIGPNLETFRSESSRERAFKGKEFDKNARQGRHQAGVYKGTHEFKELF